MRLLVAAIVGGFLFALAAYGVYRAARDVLTPQIEWSERAVINRVEDVAKLVSSEFYARDVVEYKHSFLGSVKTTLAVVDVRGLVGVDLKDRCQVRIDPAARKVHITIPHSTVLATEVQDVRFYDSRGVWNKPTQVDRDLVLQRIRERLPEIGRSLKVGEQADRSAKRLLERMFTVDGYQAEVQFFGVNSHEAP